MPTCSWFTEQAQNPVVLAHLAAAAAALMMTYLACHPILSFIRRGWQIKKEDIASSLSTRAKAIYLSAFLKENADNPDNKFDEIYERRYGKYRLRTPVVLLAITLFPMALLVAESAVAKIVSLAHWPANVVAGITNSSLVIPDTAVGAIIGAYTWVVYSLVASANSYNLPPSTVISSVLRLIVAVPLGYAVGSILAASLGPFAAFAVGAFPLSTVQVILQRIATKQLNLDIGTDTRRDQVTQLSGVDPPIADRLQEADISTIPQLAYADPVQISMRTNLGFNFVLDLVGQALAWIYLGEKLNALRPLALRGAVEFLNLMRDLNSKEEEVRALSERALIAVAAKADIEQNAFRKVCQEIAGDPYTLFVDAVWLTSGAAMKTDATLQPDEDEDEIRTRAYFIWQNAGQPGGHEGEYWRQAELAIAGERDNN